MTCKIITIGFDGLHRSGKGTQIKLLSDYLLNQEIPHRVVRGDGTRAGNGSRVYDPPSEWWGKNLSFFRRKSNSLEEDIEKMHLKYQRLNREAKLIRDYTIPKEVLRTNSELGVMIMDRTFLSRYFTMKQYLPDISLKSALDVKNPKTGKKVEVIIPNLTFVLEGNKETLLQRATKSDESGSEKFKFKIKIINHYYDLFNSVIGEMKYEKGILCLDSSQSPKQIHKKILNNYNKLV